MNVMALNGGGDDGDGGEPQEDGPKCVSGYAPNVFGPVHDTSDGVLCGSRLTDGAIGRCPWGMCCSEYSYCGPTPDAEGNFHAGGYLNGPIISYEMSETLFCERNQGDWRYISCDSEGAVQVFPPQNLVERAESVGIFTALLGAIEQSGLGDLLRDQTQPVTVFAPTDGAFALVDPAMLEMLLDPANLASLVAVLSYHVAAGTHAIHTLIEEGSVTTISGAEVFVTVPDGDDDIYVNDAIVVQPDLFAVNGVIHAIGKVMIPPPPNPQDNNIIDVMTTSGQFTILLQAVSANGFGDSLRAAGPMTLFAPTDAAFAAMDPDELTALLDPANLAQLISTLTYHVVPSANTAAELATMTSIETVNGGSLTIASSGTGLTINGNDVVLPDMAASNGIVHGIDGILIP